MSDFDFEPVRGLPERLPPGEELLWQGVPDWRGLAVRMFHTRVIAIYFGALALWNAGTALYEGQPLAAAAVAASWALALGLCALGILLTIAWLIGRTTVYSITSKRLVMRIGIAMTMTVNVPFAQIDSAALKRRADGSGDIPLTLKPSERIGYVMLWPHARPWKFARPQPMLRAVPDAEHVAGLLADALSATVEPAETVSSRVTEQSLQKAEPPRLAAAS